MIALRTIVPLFAASVLAMLAASAFVRPRLFDTPRIDYLTLELPELHDEVARHQGWTMVRQTVAYDCDAGKCMLLEPPAPHDASVEIGRANVVGSMPRAIIDRYVKRHADRFLACYERLLLANDTDHEGRITALFHIDRHGHVESVDVDGFDARVAECLEHEIAQLRFPHACRGGFAKVFVPMLFVAAREPGYERYWSRGRVSTRRER